MLGLHANRLFSVFMRRYVQKAVIDMNEVVRAEMSSRREQTDIDATTIAASQVCMLPWNTFGLFHVLLLLRIL